MNEISPAASTANSPPRPGINWKSEIQQYGTAVLAALIIFLALSVYLFNRRGYYDLFIANKVFAGVAAVLLGIVLLLGPLSRLFSFSDRYVQYRKELGIVAFLLALIHSVVSLFFLPSKFPLSKFLGTLNWALLFGLAAVLVLLVLFCISNTHAMIALGGKRWWRFQYWGVRSAFALVLLHIFVMKWKGWVRWYQVGGGSELVHPEWPGAGILVGWFLAFVVVFRIAEFLSPRLGRVVWYCSVIGFPLITIATFWWGRQFLK